MEFDPRQMPWRETYNLLTASIYPRPIAWVSTVDGEGRPNLAPFSFFNMFCAEPPLVGFAPMVRGSDGSRKDTLRNIETTGEFVLNAVTHRLVEQMNISSTEAAPAVNEFELAGLTAVPSLQVRPARVAESPIHLECKLHEIYDFGQQPGGSSLVIGRVVQIHVADDLLQERNHIDMAALDLVGRMGGSLYARSTETFRLERPGTGGRTSSER